MAQENARLVNAQPLLDKEGYIVVWESNNGTMFSYDLELDMNGETVHVKAFSKKDDGYPIPTGTDIVFSSDWNTSRGLAYAKGVKDANSSYVQNNGGGRPQGQRPQGQRPQARPQQQQQQSSAPAPVAPKGLTPKQVIEQTTMAALKYLQVAAMQKEVNLNLTTIKDIATSYAGWVSEFDNKAVALKALNAAIETSKLNESLAANEATINNSKELKAVAALYYEFFIA